MNRGFALGPEEGEVVSAFFGDRIVKISPDTTGGWGIAIAVETCPPGFEAPLHIHHTEDGAFYILQGALFMRLGEREVAATPGTFVFMPREVPHAFKVISSEPARWLNIQGPTGDWGNYAREMAELTKDGRQPAQATRSALAKKYGIEPIEG